MIQDHLGQKFQNMKAMANAYNINYSTLRRRLKTMSIEEALTTPIYIPNVSDHLGNTYPSQDKMCQHYNIPLRCYKDRLRRGWDIERSLTTPPTDYTTTDHLNNTFSSTRQMCEHYEIDTSVFRNRIKKGWSLKEALTTPPGQTPPSQKHKKTTSVKSRYDINNEEAIQRLQNGETLEEIINSFSTPKKSYEIIDHKGNHFKSIGHLCKYWGINPGTFRSRRDAGMTIQESLETPVQIQHNPHLKTYTDPYGHTYDTMQKFCKAWNISINAFQHRMGKGWSIIETINLIPRINSRSVNLQIFNNLTILRNIKDNKSSTNYYEICLDGENTIMTYNAIIELCINILRKERENGK